MQISQYSLVAGPIFALIGLAAYSFRPSHNTLRWGGLGLTIGGLMFGLGAILFHMGF